MSKYLVTLTPMGKFFFGGDMTFETGRKEQDKKYASYIIHSSMMPQQTSLLGMMRFLLLSNDGKLFSKEKNCIVGSASDVEDLIGAKSFSVNIPSSKNKFGRIKTMGPCFIYNKGEDKPYFRCAKDALLDVNHCTIVEAFINGVKIQIPELKVKARLQKKDEYYSSKDYLETSYVSADGSSSIKESKLFVEDSRIGINKSYDGTTKNSAFFKQISYRLEDGFCFAFIAELEMTPDEVKKYNGQLVNVGGDASNFLLEIKKTSLEYPQKSNDGKVVLLSDAYIPKMPAMDFAITGVRSFRFLQTQNSEKASHYHVKHGSFCRSDRYDLYEAGSVFYVKDKNSFCSILDSMKEFTQIGYNYYI